jgi:hypothetical protein
MTIDTYGISSDRYRELFVHQYPFLLELYQLFENNLRAKYPSCIPPHKTRWELFNVALYATNDEARKVQKRENPKALKEEEDWGFISPSREELLDEIKSLHAKVEALIDYLDNLVSTIKEGVTEILDTVEEGGLTGPVD